MEFDEMLISTGVDSLIKLVREKGKIEITLASRLLNIPISTIEEWSHALESEGIIAIEYQLTKVFLKWVAPTEEKVDEERTALMGDKARLTAEIKTLEEKSQAQMAAVAALKDDFNSNYGKIMGKLEELGGKSTGMQQAKGFKESDYYKAVDQLEEVRGQISQVRDSLKFMQEQLEKTRGELTGSEIERKVSAITGSREGIASLKDELESMESKVTKAVDSLVSRKEEAENVHRSMEGISEDFAALKKKMDYEREMLKELDSISVIFTTAKKELAALRSSTEEAMDDIKGFRGTYAEMERKAASVSARMRENEAKATRLLEDIKSAQETFENLGAGGEAGERIKDLVAEGKALEDKMAKFQGMSEEVLPLFENVDKLISSLSELRKKVGEERKRLAEESGAIFASLDEEIATYSTFQKIKEKAISNINDYLNQLEKINVSYENAANSAERVEKKLDETFSEFKSSDAYKHAEDLSSYMETLGEKKKLLEDIRAGIDSLDSSAMRSAKQVKLLAKELDVLNMRAGSVPAAEAKERTKRVETGIRESITLTETEQHEFDSKREELRKLIKKLWEEE